MKSLPCTSKPRPSQQSLEASGAWASSVPQKMSKQSMCKRMPRPRERVEASDCKRSMTEPFRPFRRRPSNSLLRNRGRIRSRSNVRRQAPFVLRLWRGQSVALEVLTSCRGN